MYIGTELTLLVSAGIWDNSGIGSYFSKNQR